MAAFIMDILEAGEKKELLEKRLDILQSVATEIEKQSHETCKREEPDLHSVNLNRMIDIVNAEISGTERLLSIYENY